MIVFDTDVLSMFAKIDAIDLIFASYARKLMRFAYRHKRNCFDKNPSRRILSDNLSL